MGTTALVAIVKAVLAVGGLRTRMALVGLVLPLVLSMSCTGPPMPRHLRKFAEVDVLSPDVRTIRIVEVEARSEIEEMGDVERQHIARELRNMIEGTLARAGYEVVSTGGDAELRLTYLQSRASPGDSARRRRVADVSLAVVDEARMEVLYRGYSIHLPDEVPDGLFAFDVVKNMIEEHVDRVFGPSEWD